MENSAENAEQFVSSVKVLQEKSGEERCLTPRCGKSYYDLLWSRLNGDDESEIGDTIGFVREEVLGETNVVDRENEEARVSAYKLIRCQHENIEGEIGIDEAFEILGLSKDASLRDVRRGFIDLGKKWHPDLMHPEDKDKFEQIFGFNESSDLVETAKNIAEDADNDGKHAQYAAVQREMVKIAGAKMSEINRAYHVILSSFSSREKESLDGFEWIDVVHSGRRWGGRASNCLRDTSFGMRSGDP